MLYVTNINQDNTISVKITEQNCTNHYSIEQVASLTIPILGVFRNPNNPSEVTMIRPIEPDNVSMQLLPIIDMIQTPQLKAFANYCRRIIPLYFFEVAASSSGKYHPASNLGFGGLVRHTIFACENIKHITDLESTRLLFNLNQESIDCMIIACMMHDFLKQGWDKQLKDFSQHPNNAANAIRGMVYFLDQSYLEFIAKCIETHMGEWNTDRSGNVITRKPETVYEWMVHLADYMASRPNKPIVLNNTNYVKSGENIEYVGTPKERVAISEIELNTIKNCLMGQRDPITPDILNKFGITRSAEEVMDIWNSIVTSKAATGKQKKYVDLAIYLG